MDGDGTGPRRPARERSEGQVTRSRDDLALAHGGRYWDRTSDLFGVNEALYR
jgi:hypothetical protein